MRKGKYDKRAAEEFEVECGSPPGGWHIRRNDNHEPVVPGRCGELYPYGPGEIGVLVLGSKKVATAIRKGWVPICGEYDPADSSRGAHQEEAFVVPAAELDEAAKFIQAFRRRKQMSPEAKRRAIECLEAARASCAGV